MNIAEPAAAVAPESSCRVLQTTAAARELASLTPLRAPPMVPYSGSPLCSGLVENGAVKPSEVFLGTLLW